MEAQGVLVTKLPIRRVNVSSAKSRSVITVAGTAIKMAGSSSQLGSLPRCWEIADNAGYRRTCDTVYTRGGARNLHTPVPAFHHITDQRIQEMVQLVARGFMWARDDAG